MTLTISKQSTTDGLKNIVEQMSGEILNNCYQCRKCTNGCPVAKYTSVTPSEIVRNLQLGAGDEILNSEMVWICLSCETCYARCPMGINISVVIDALRSLAIERNAKKPVGDMPLFNQMFLGTVRSFGRSYDLSMIVAYKLRTYKILQDIEKIPSMFRKGKLGLLPPSGADRQTIKNIFSRTINKRFLT